MEKFRAFLEVLKKYHFWVLCGLIVLLVVRQLVLGDRQRRKELLTRKSTIDGNCGLVNKIASNNEHPSNKYIEQIRDRESGPLTSQVANASSRLYREMRDANPLARALFRPKRIRKDFEAAFEKIWGPMEEIEKLPPQPALDDFTAVNTGTTSTDYFPQLFNLIERRTEVDNPDEPGGRRSSHAAPRPARQWDCRRRCRRTGQEDGRHRRLGRCRSEDQVDSSSDLPDNPNTLDIMMAQEDLWVYETLLKVVRNTNDSVPTPSTMTQRITRNRPTTKWPVSSKSWRWISGRMPWRAGTSATGPFSICPARAAAPCSTKSQRPQVRGRATRPGRGIAMSAQDSNNSPLAGRYVDDNGKPLTDPDAATLRRIPHDADQSESRYRAEGNPPVAGGVRQLRHAHRRPPRADSRAGTAARGPDCCRDSGWGNASSYRRTQFDAARPPIAHDRFAGPRMMGNDRGDSASGKTEASYNEESADPVYPPVPVEVQGIIYIYNPPAVQTAMRRPAKMAASPRRPHRRPPLAAARRRATVPAPAGTPANSPAKTPAHGGRP